jgi:hypothetical protein
MNWQTAKDKKSEGKNENFEEPDSTTAVDYSSAYLVDGLDV